MHVLGWMDLHIIQLRLCKQPGEKIISLSCGRTWIYSFTIVEHGQNQLKIEKLPENWHHNMLILTAVVAMRSSTYFNRKVTVYTFECGQQCIQASIA